MQKVCIKIVKQQSIFLLTTHVRLKYRNTHTKRTTQKSAFESVLVVSTGYWLKRWRNLLSSGSLHEFSKVNFVLCLIFQNDGN